MVDDERRMETQPPGQLPRLPALLLECTLDYCPLHKHLQYFVEVLPEHGEGKSEELLDHVKNIFLKEYNNTEKEENVKTTKYNKIWWLC